MASSPDSGDGYSPPENREPPFLFVAIKKRWWIFLICLVVSGGVGAGVALRLSSESAEAQGSLLYAGLPMPPGPTVYKPPTIETYSALFASHTNLRRLIETHGLELDPVQLSKQLTVRPGSYRSAKIDMTLSWNDPEEVAKLLDDLMEIFIEDVVRRRSDNIDEHIRHTERMLLASSAKVDSVAERRRSNQQTEGDLANKQALIERELEKLSAAVESIKTDLETSELSKIRYQVEISALSERQAELEKVYKQKLFGDIRARYEEAKQEYGPRSSFRSRLKQAGEQIKTLMAANDDDQGLADWKIQMLEVYADITPNGEAYNDDLLEPYEEEINKIDTRIRDLQLQLVINDQSIEVVKARLAKKETELAKKSIEVPTVSDYAQQLEVEYEEANLERQRIQQQLSGLRQLEECRVREFSVATPAYISVADSNTKKLFVMATFFIALVLSAPVFVWEYLTGRAITVEQTGRKFGLPVLARGSLAPIFSGETDVDPSNVDSLRLLALRIQQSISRPGSTVLFSSLDETETTFPLICGLARCFSEREERVLILDAGKTVVANNQHLKNLFGDLPQILFADRAKVLEDGLAAAGESASESANGGTNGHTLTPTSGPIGLSDYLSRDEIDPADIVLPTRFAGVDCICGGRRTFPVEGLATKRMSDVFDHARKQYGMVLVAGPPTSQLADVQMLAARADGILFTAVPGKPLANNSHDVLQEMLDLEAPIIGIVG